MIYQNLDAILFCGCLRLTRCISWQQYRSVWVSAEMKRVRWLVLVWKMWKPAFFSSINVRIMNAMVSRVDHVQTWCGLSWMSISGVCTSSAIWRMLFMSPDVTRSYSAGHSENSMSILTKSNVRCSTWAAYIAWAIKWYKATYTVSQKNFPIYHYAYLHFSPILTDFYKFSLAHSVDIIWNKTIIKYTTTPELWDTLPCEM